MKNKSHACFSAVALKKIDTIANLCLVMAIVQLIGFILLVPMPTKAADPPATVRLDRVRFCTGNGFCFSELTRPQYSFWDDANVSKDKQKETYLSIVSEPPKSDVHNLVFLTAGLQTDDGKICNVTGQPDNYKAGWDDHTSHINIALTPRYILEDVYRNNLFEPDDTFIALAFDANYNFEYSETNRAQTRNAFYEWLKSKFNPNNIQNIYLAGHSRGGCLVMMLAARFNRDFPNANIIVQGFDPVCRSDEFGMYDERIYNPYFTPSGSILTDRFAYKTDVATQFTNNKVAGLLHAYVLVGGAPISTLAIGVRAFTDKDATTEHYTEGNWYEQDWTELNHQDIRKDKSTVDKAIVHLETSIIYPPGTPSLDLDWIDQGANSGDTQEISLNVNKASPDDEVKIQCQGIGCSEFDWTMGTTSCGSCHSPPPPLIDTEIADNQVVKYRIKARNAVAESEWSDWFSVTIGDRTPPSPFPLTIKLIYQGPNSGDTQIVEIETDEAISGSELVEYETYIGLPIHHREKSKFEIYRTPADVHDNQTYGIQGRIWDLNGNYSSWVKVSLRISDYTSPNVTNVTGDFATCGDGLQTIIATLDDNVGVVNASLYYTPIGGNETSLDFTTGSADIPIAANPFGDIPYYITVRDGWGNYAHSPQSGNYTITVMDPSLDSDGDTIGDCDDGCPFDSKRVSPEFGGCGSVCLQFIRNESTQEVFNSIQAAINDPYAIDYDNIQITTAVLNEYVVYDRDIILTLSGGYFCNFSDNTAMSSINSLIIRNGTVITDKLIIW